MTIHLIINIFPQGAPCGRTWLLDRRCHEPRIVPFANSRHSQPARDKTNLLCAALERQSAAAASLSFPFNFCLQFWQRGNSPPHCPKSFLLTSSGVRGKRSWLTANMQSLWGEKRPLHFTLLSAYRAPLVGVSMAATHFLFVNESPAMNAPFSYGSDRQAEGSVNAAYVWMNVS